MTRSPRATLSERRTDDAFKAAVKRLAQVKANVKVKVEEEDLSDDFSREEPSVAHRALGAAGL